MNKTAIIKLMLAGALGLALAGVSPAAAQSTLGGVKPQQNKIGGAAKPPPVVGGATIHTPPPTPPKVGPLVNVAKPGSTVTPTPGAGGTITPLGTTANNVRPNPPVTTPSGKGAKVANLKCASGACTSRGPKP